MHVSENKLRKIIREEIRLVEKLIKKTVWRDAEEKEVWTTDREGYKVVYKDDKPTEVPMTPGEKRRRSTSQKKAAQYRSVDSELSQRRRNITMRTKH